MAVTRGAFNDLLRPGLKAAWDEAYSDRKLTLGYKVSKELMEDDLYTGIHETFPGQLWFDEPPKRDIRDTPYAEDEWPPKDWPDWP